MSDRLVELLSGWSVHRRGLILVLSGAMAALFAAGLPMLKVDSSPDALVSTVDGQAEVTERFRTHFPGSDTQLIVVVQSSDVTGLEEVRLQRQLTAAFSKQPGVARVDSFSSMSLNPAHKPLEKEAATLQPAQHQELLQRLQHTPWVSPVLLSHDRTTAALIVHFDDDQVFDQHTRMTMLSSVRAIVEQQDLPDGVSLTLGGVPVLREAILRKLEKDQLTLNPAMMLVCLLVLALTFRWWPAVVAPLCAVGISALMVIGGMSYLGVPLTILTNIIPPLLIIVGLSDSVHLLGRYGEELAVDSDPVRAGRRAARAMLVACFLTSLTTALGFASLATAKTPELGRFGVAAAFGVIFAYFATVLFVPAFVTQVKAPTHGSRGDAPGIIERSVFAITRLVLRQARWVAVFSALLALGLGYGATRVTADARLLDAFQEGEEVTRTTRLMERQLAGIRPLEVMIESNGGSLLEPDVVDQVEDVAEWLRSEPNVIAATSYVEPLRAAQVLNPGAVEPGEKESLRDWITDDKKAAKMTAFFEDAGIRRSLVVLEELKKRLQTGALSQHRISFAGEAYTGSVGRDYVLRDLLSGLGVALATIFVLLTILFRSLRLGLVAMPPNLIPLLGTGAYMMARGIHLNMATVITFSIGIGLAVDDTVHVVARFQEERKRISSVRVALLRAARGTGRAIVVTAISLSLGFSVLLLSEFVSVRQFGELISVTVINCLLSALLIQPALLLLVSKRSAPNTAAGA